ncbi:MAG: methyltransferase domain-containing protein [Candidatus Eisenbacteria bacterium]|nr:methyltransferase domain-containing protein [Candidatus Eisenbacteria bacterium]
MKSAWLDKVRNRDNSSEPASPVEASPRAREDHAPLPRPLTRAAILDRIRGIEWYHTVDLGQGVVTPGFYDHAPHLDRYGLPARLDGKRVLDVATFDGYWAFEFERRGAREVVGLDIPSWRHLDLAPSVRARMAPELLDEPTGAGFLAAREILGSQVRREILNVYDLSPERLGKFDLVFCGDLLLHIQNPVRALQNICSVTSGSAYIVDCYRPELPDDVIEYRGARRENVWWHFSYGALRRMVTEAGFRSVEVVSRFEVPPRSGGRGPKRAVFRALP